MNNTAQPDSLVSIGVFYNKAHQRSPVTDLFFAPDNIIYLQNQLQYILRCLTNQQIIAPINNEFVDSMIEIARNNVGMAYFGHDGLKALNEQFLDKEARILYVSLRHRNRYYNDFVNGDRMRVFPYGAPEKVTGGEVVYDASSYQLRDPYRKHYTNFLKDIMCVTPDNK